MKIILKKIYILILKYLFPLCYETRFTQTPITIKHFFIQKFLKINKKVYWPVHFTSKVTSSHNIYAGIDTSPGYMPGCYIQGIGKIYIGDYTQIASNVGIISANHNLYDTRIHEKGTVKIGKYCWIGMNSVILPNVNLGNFTIVGAGSVVTKSFKEGYCVIAGNPAKLVKKLNPENCIEFENEFKYNGFIKSSEFEKFRRDYLNV